MSTLKKFAGQTAIYGLSTVLSRLLNFLLTRLYVSAYPAKVFGIFTYLYSWASLANALIALGMETTFFRYLNKHEQDKDKVYNNSFLIIAATSLVFVAFALLFSQTIGSWMHKDPEAANDYPTFIRYFIFILVFDALAVIPFAKVRADGKPLRFGVIKLINITTFIAFNLFFILVLPRILIKGDEFGNIFYWYKGPWVGYVFLSNLIASVVTLLLLLPELRKIRISPQMSLIKDMLSYSLPVLVANLSFIINENLDKIFLKELLPGSEGELQVGIYGACAKIALFLSIFVQAFRLGAEPFFFSQQKAKNSGETYATVMNYFIITVSFIFLALVANIEVLKYFIESSDPVEKLNYWSGLKIVPVLLFGYVSLGIYMNLSIWYKLSDQTRFGLYISGVGALLTIVLNLILIPRYGYIASAWISLTAYTSMMILSYVLGQRNYPIPYNLKKNLAYLSTSIIFVILSFITFERSLIAGNLLLIIFCAGTYFIERKELTNLLKK